MTNQSKKLDCHAVYETARNDHFGQMESSYERGNKNQNKITADSHKTH